MLAFSPQGLTNEELISAAYQHVMDGLPVAWQYELSKRLERAQDQLNDHNIPTR